MTYVVMSFSPVALSDTPEKENKTSGSWRCDFFFLTLHPEI
jgi:hypothetical protein